MKTLGCFCGVPEAMHLRDYSSFFQPEEFVSLTAAYDAAWQQLWAKRLTLTSDQVPVLKKIWRRSFSLPPATASET